MQVAFVCALNNRKSGAGTEPAAEGGEKASFVCPVSSPVPPLELCVST